MLAVVVSVDAVTGIILAACAFATLALGVGLRQRGRTRSRWRTQDRVEGYVDDRKIFHVGSTDLVLGYADENGVWHDGLDVRVARLEADKRQRDDAQRGRD